jgi:subtilisin family serine protease
MHGWAFRDIEHDTTCSAVNTCSLAQMVSGPDSTPAGTGSADLTAGTAATSRKMALVTNDLSGTRLDAITSLAYSSYRQSGGPNAIAIAFDVDYDLTDSIPGAEGIMVFLATKTDTSLSPQGSWVTWDPTTTGRWGGTEASVHQIHLGMQSIGPNICRIAKQGFLGGGPCTWVQLTQAYPNMGIAVGGRFGFYAQDQWDTFAGLGQFHGNVDKLQITVGGVASTLDFELSDPVPPVPALPPTSPPRYSPNDLISDGRGGQIVRGAVMVQFHEGTNQALRQSAVAAVQGMVVGGYPIVDGDGFYYLSVPDTGTANTVNAALAILDTLPQVALAAPIRIEHSTAWYLKPHEGDADFQSWNLNPDSAAGANWALERVRAPMAWGCTVGSQSTKIGVLDWAPDTIAGSGSGVMQDIAANTGYLNTVSYFGTNDAYTHGRMVTSVLAAGGDNSIGMTGMMWRADLRLLHFQAEPDSMGVPAIIIDSLPDSIGVARLDLTERQLVKLGLQGASVINLSLGKHWAFEDHWPSLSNPADTSEVVRWSKAVSNALRLLATRGFQPLIVIAAGNEAIPSFWAGYTIARRDFPNQVIVVGASDFLDQRWSVGVHAGSQGGDLVDLYAPGVEVGALNGTGTNGTTVVRKTGTSFAAPLVAGVAGLLKSLDPTLTAAQIKQYILEGAQRRNVVVDDGKYLLDAYEALKAAARRVGGPICGNRFFLDSIGRFTVERQTGSGTWVDDMIPAGDFSNFDPLSQSVGIEPKHDGDLVDFSGDAQYTIKYQNGSWSRFVKDTLANPRVHSWVLTGLSHGGDSIALLTQNAATFSVGIGTAVAGAGGQHTINASIPGIGIWAAMPKIGNEVLVTRRTTPGVSGSDVLAVDKTTGAVRILYTDTSSQHFTLLPHTQESGEEFVLTYTSGSGPMGTTTCHYEWHSMANGAVLRTMAVPRTYNTCDLGTAKAGIALDRDPTKRPTFGTPRR